MKYSAVVKGRLGCAGILMVACMLRAQTMPVAPDVIRIVKPVVDKAAGRVTLPTAFWNEQVAAWVEVGVCGRPSDFLHETVVSVTTTRTLLEGALRDAGFHDADAWVDSVKDFPRIRGDRMLILVELVRDGKKETYSLDELLEFREWGVAAGAYGFEFRGDPEHANAAASQPGDGPAGEDATKILRDDPQIALTFKGLQSVSQSFADHPLAYDDWIYPMMDFGRNPAALPNKVYDSNGEVKATLIIQKVGEEEFLKESANVWHDEAFRQFMLKQLPIAHDIDLWKKEYWGLRPDVLRIRGLQAPSDSDKEVLAGVAETMAQIEKGYATLDAAWGAWAVDHATFPEFSKPPATAPSEGQATREEENKQILAELKAEAARWKEHLALEQTRAENLAAAETLVSGQLAVAHLKNSEADLARLRGRELEARSAAMLAENKQPLERWKAEKEHLDATHDPRAEWIKHVNQQVELAEAREEAGMLGTQLGGVIAKTKETDPATRDLQAKYLAAQARMQLADLQMQLTDVDFEVGKREGFADDPDLPALKSRKNMLEGEISRLEAATRPGKTP